MMPSPTHRRTARRRRLRLAAAVVVSAVVATACDGLYRYDVEIAVDDFTNAQPSVIFARDGTAIITLKAEENRTEIDLTEMGLDPRCRDDVKPPETEVNCGTVVNAVIAIEDERYWDHRGVDVKALLRAIVRNAEEGEIVEGGSTITQQWVKNQILTDEQTAGRKAREAITALQVDRKYEKDYVLASYLNTIYFGNGQYGVEAAALYYFGEHAKDLSVAQAALIAGLPKSPSTLDPYTNPEDARARRNLVLDAMLDQGYISKERYDEAKVTPIGAPTRPSVRGLDGRMHLEPGQLLDHSPTLTEYKAPHFVDAVKRWILNDPEFGRAIEAKGYQDTKEVREDLLFRQGLRITTTVDLELQALAEQAMEGVFPDPADQWPTAALVTVDPRTGEVLAMVGGRADYFGTDPRAKFDFASVGRRQTGSSFKPFVLAAALELDIPPLTQIDSTSPARILLPDGKFWEPRNAEGSGRGMVDLIEATRSSINAAYANLIVLVGPEYAVEVASKLGIESPMQPYYSSVLGSNEVTPLDMATAYATLANDGVRNDHTFVLTVTTANGEEIYSHTPTGEKAVEPDTARTVSQIMTQVICCGTAAREGPLPDARPAAGKTGTNQDYKDAWFVGYTSCEGAEATDRCLSTAVWVGFGDRPRPMQPPATPKKVFGGTYPTEIWHDFMAAAHAGHRILPFAEMPAWRVPVTTTTQALPIPLPSVVGLPVEEAKTALRSAGFSSITELQKLTGPEVVPGTVVGQEPGAGLFFLPDTTILLEVATPAPIVPDVIGRTVAEARSAVETAGFVVQVQTELRSGATEAEAGRIWRSLPVAGTAAATGTTIVLTANPEPQLTTPTPTSSATG
jgi:penicillin-binding protein 1A